MIQNKVQLGYLVVIVLLLALIRLVPHPPNAVPIAAMALFAGAFFIHRPLAYFMPIAAMFISDLFIGFHTTIGYVYASIVLIVLIGSLLKRISIVSVGVSALLASIMFFLITNFGAWLHHDMYAQSLNGLLQAYIAGLPFLRNTLIANLIFTYLVFYSLSSFFDIKAATKSS